MDWIVHQVNDLTKVSNEIHNTKSLLSDKDEWLYKEIRVYSVFSPSGYAVTRSRLFDYMDGAMGFDPTQVKVFTDKIYNDRGFAIVYLTEADL